MNDISSDKQNIGTQVKGKPKSMGGKYRGHDRRDDYQVGSTMSALQKTPFRGVKFSIVRLRHMTARDTRVSYFKALRLAGDRQRQRMRRPRHIAND
jgi:hypothetical protein